jgi:hypothetical protein
MVRTPGTREEPAKEMFSVRKSLAPPKASGRPIPRPCDAAIAVEPLHEHSIHHVGLAHQRDRPTGLTSRALFRCAISMV